MLIAALLIAVSIGSEHLAFFDLSDTQRSILFDIRLPRVLLGACVGASLAAAGASLQALLRNPLAEPYLLGVSNGAALGTMLAFVFFEQFVFARPLFAFAGAGLATFTVYQMARSRAGNECRTPCTFRCHRHDVLVIDHCSVYELARCGTASGIHILAARRSVAGDNERFLFDARCIRAWNNRLEGPSTPIESDDDR